LANGQSRTTQTIKQGLSLDRLVAIDINFANAWPLCNDDNED
jgi:hypothetical protein